MRRALTLTLLLALTLGVSACGGSKKSSSDTSTGSTKVEPDDERGLCDRLEVDGAVARPVRAALGLVHEARLAQRFQRKRDRRLRDPGPPGDLSARDRRARTDRLEHLAFVDSLEQARHRASLAAVAHGNKPNETSRRCLGRLTSLTRLREDPVRNPNQNRGGGTG